MNNKIWYILSNRCDSESIQYDIKFYVEKNITRSEKSPLGSNKFTFRPCPKYVKRTKKDDKRDNV